MACCEMAQKVDSLVGSGWTQIPLGDLEEKGQQTFDTIKSSEGGERAPDDKIWRNALLIPFS